MAYRKEHDRRKIKRHNLHVMLDDDCMDALKAIADESNVSVAWLVRACICGTLEEYKSHVVYIDREQGNEIKRLVMELNNTLHRVETEINRCGNNLNQIARDANRMCIEMEKEGKAPEKPAVTYSQTDDIAAALEKAADTVSMCSNKAGDLLWRM